MTRAGSTNRCLSADINSFDKNTNKSYVYLTVYGHAANANKPLSFKLWQASTGNVYNLTTERVIQYRENGIEGYAPQQPVAFFAYAGLSQLISVKQGWNWLSLNLKPVGNGILNTAMPAAQGWETGEIRSLNGKDRSTAGTTRRCTWFMLTVRNRR